MRPKEHCWRIFGSLSKKKDARSLARAKQFWQGYALALMDSETISTKVYVYLLDSINLWSLSDDSSSIVTPEELQPIRPQDYPKWRGSKHEL